MLFSVSLKRVFNHGVQVIQSDSKSRKTSPQLESLTWPHEVPTTLAFLFWQLLAVGCRTLCSGPVLQAL